MKRKIQKQLGKRNSCYKVEHPQGYMQISQKKHYEPEKSGKLD